MRIAWLLLVSGCVAGFKTNTSSSSSSGPSGSSSSTTASDDGRRGPIDNAGRAPDGPSRQPPAGRSTEIALSPGPSRNGDVVVGPGGPISEKEADCSGANGHCLRGSYFCKTMNFQPVFIFEGKFYTWKGQDCGQDYAFKTVPATPENIRDGTRILVLITDDESSSRQATSESDALVNGQWYETSVTAVDAAAGKFTDGRGGRWKIANARVMLDWIHAK